MCIQDLRAKSSTVRALLGACATIVIAMVSLPMTDSASDSPSHPPLSGYAEVRNES